METASQSNTRQSSSSQSLRSKNSAPKQEEREGISSGALYSVMGLMLLFGTLNTVIMKMQDEVVVGTDKDGVPQKFTHPYFQCAVMFLGEFFCLFLYAMKRSIYGKTPGTQDDEMNPLLIAIPACFDICGSTFMFIALTMCAASVYQMMRGVIVVITAFMALVFLGRKQYAHHWISLSTIVLGVFIVGFVSIMASQKDVSAGATSITGVLLLLAAQCFTGGQFVTEEKLLGEKVLDPLYVVGFEGLWGCCVFAVLLPIFQQIECYGELCHNGRLEDSLAALQEFQAHPILIAQSGCNILTIAGFNLTGVMITKYASAAQRSTVDTCRTLIIWCVFLALGKEKFLVGEMFGFALLVLGTLIYNEIIEVPFTFMNKNTKRNIQKREEELAKAQAQVKKSISRSSTEGTSPTAASGESNLDEYEALLANKGL